MNNIYKILKDTPYTEIINKYKTTSKDLHTVMSLTNYIDDNLPSDEDFNPDLDIIFKFLLDIDTIACIFLVDKINDFLELFLMFVNDSIDIKNNYINKWKSLLIPNNIEYISKIIEFIFEFIELNESTIDQENINDDFTKVHELSLQWCEYIELIYIANQDSNCLNPEVFHLKCLNENMSIKYNLHLYKIGKVSFCSYPFLLNTTSKAKLLKFESLVLQDISLISNIFDIIYSGSSTLTIIVSRENIISDTLRQLSSKSKDLIKPLRVTFKGEEGFDEGGLSKEFFQIIMTELFNPMYGMFTHYENNLYNFNSFSFEANIEFELIGILIGIAIYNGIILNLNFPKFIYKKILGEKLTIYDLFELDEQLARNFLFLLNDLSSSFEDIYGDINFTITYKSYGVPVVYDLCENGSNIFLNQDNKHQYVELYLDHFFNVSIEEQFKSFMKGFNKVMYKSDVFTWFRGNEIEKLICGELVFDIMKLKEKAKYTDGYTESSTIIEYFWNTVEQLSENEKKKLLLFITGSDRIPINGISDVTITISRQGPDSENLPTAHTCFNHLLIPEYSSEEKFKKKLLIALNHCTGFGLI